ncbi:unnamed protein product [Prunus armeniaca]
MGSSSETRGGWSMMEDVSLSEAWVQEFCERAIGSNRTKMTLSSRWKILNKELAKWRDALAKMMDNHKSRENLNSEIMQAQMWFGATG